MNEANTKKLYTDFPGLYRDATNQRSMMKFGFDCNDGWFNLIYKLSADIELEAKKLNIEPKSDSWPCVLQVKEKMGTLRFYCEVGETKDELVHEKVGELISYRPLPSNTAIRALINEAESKSAKICEGCGCPSKLRKEGWWRVTCDNCELERRERDIHSGEKYHQYEQPAATQFEASFTAEDIQRAIADEDSLGARTVPSDALKVYLDDERIAPEGWVQVRWPDEAIKLLQTGSVSHLSLDHDLGDDQRGTGYDVLLWIEQEVVSSKFIPPSKIEVHSANPAARERMLVAIESIRLHLSQMERNAQ